MEKHEDWTAYYAPVESVFHKSGFESQESVLMYIQSFENPIISDRWAWFILPTEIFNKCQDLDDIMIGAGCGPMKKFDENWKLFDVPAHVVEYKNRCKRLGINDS